MKQQHILLIFSTIILVGSLILLIDDAPKEDSGWTNCFPKEFRDNVNAYSITMNFTSDQSIEKDTLKFTSNLQDLDTIESYPIKNQSIEHALRTLRELEIHTEEYDRSDLEQFGLGTSSKLEIIVSNKNGDSSFLNIGNDTQVGYSTYINCNGKISRSRNTISHGIPTDLISYKNLFAFTYSLPQIKSFQMDGFIIEEIDGFWWQTQPYRTQLQLEIIESFFTTLIDLSGTNVQKANKNPLSKPVNSGSILLQDQEVSIPFRIFEQTDSSLQLQHRSFDYTFERDELVVLLDFQKNIEELYSTSLHHQMDDVSKIELKYHQLTLNAEKIPSDDEIQESKWNDDGKLFQYITNDLTLKRIPNWNETEHRENSCAKDVDYIGTIRIFIENRFFEYPICQVSDTIYLTSSFEDGLIQVMNEPDNLSKELNALQQ